MEGRFGLYRLNSSVCTFRGVSDGKVQFEEARSVYFRYGRAEDRLVSYLTLPSISLFSRPRFIPKAARRDMPPREMRSKRPPLIDLSRLLAMRQLLMPFSVLRQNITWYNREAFEVAGAHNRLNFLG